MKKETIVFILKLIAAIVASILSVLGASSLTSCTAARTSYQSIGNTRIVTVDTTTIHHTGNLQIKIK